MGHMKLLEPTCGAVGERKGDLPGKYAELISCESFAERKKKFMLLCFLPASVFVGCIVLPFIFVKVESYIICFFSASVISYSQTTTVRPCQSRT